MKLDITFTKRVDMGRPNPGFVIAGTVDVINHLQESVFKNVWFKDKNPSYGVIEGSGNSYQASNFFCEIWKLKASGKTNPQQTIGQELLAFINGQPSDAEVTFKEDSRFMLEYWSFESQRIKSGLSYRSSLAESSAALTDSDTLLKIIYRYQQNNKKNPSVEDLFNFLEGSRLVQTIRYSQPPLPCDFELEKFAGPRFPDVMNRYSFHSATKKTPLTEEREAYITGSMRIITTDRGICFDWSSITNPEIAVFEARLLSKGITYKNQGGRLIVEAKEFASIEEFEMKLNIKNSDYSKQLNRNAPEVMALREKQMDALHEESITTYQRDSSNNFGALLKGAMKRFTEYSQEVLERNQISNRELIKEAIENVHYVPATQTP